ncbi:fibronectin type III domain protein [Kribbella sp. VKM Ac-2527]|uniref:Fibronectin type III domain protein n=1 Tax=Kribbella caucasensis TaxID=2512215 RepID=A0A4R6KJJ0_9ACTN|nr:fibronectin type III domain-containing protein [Kribbella sp. VKM Ac-2527]TDO50642.1 fibronectin type III domain protein [Kribbella sp. VKM Ac-2527]
MAITGVAVAGAGNASPGVQFSRSSSWIYNSTLGMIFHVNGSTKNVDSQVSLPGAGPGTQIVESDQSGYVLARGRTYEFGKSDLKVLDPQPAPANEQPIGLEGSGAAFAVYRQSGRVVRFNDQPAVATVGARLGQPVVTSSGTLWVNRLDNGQLCQLPMDADRLSCPAKLPPGHTGALTVVGNDQVAFVDTTARELYAVDAGGLGRKVPVRLPELSGAALVASNDVDGRIAMVDPRQATLHLVDTAELDGGEPGAAPVKKQLRQGKYERIASSGNSIALIDDGTDTLITLDRDGNEKAVRKIPPPSAKARVGRDDRSGLFRGGDSRLYVASKSGEQVMVVDDTGDVTSVDTSRPATSKPERPSDTPTTTPDPPQQNRPTNRPSQPQTTDPRTNDPRTNDPRTTEPTDRPGDEPGDDRTRQPRRPRETAKPPIQASRPGVPRAVSGAPGNGSATITWGAAASNGATVTSYRVSWNGGTRTLAGTDRSTTITGLTNGMTYTFTVRAVNRVGAGPGSNTRGIVPTLQPADPPANFRVVPGDRKITVSWARPNLRGGQLVEYRYSASGPGEWPAGRGLNTSHTFTGLANGDYFVVEVYAVTSDAKGNLISGKKVSKLVEVGSGGGGSSPSLRAARGAATSTNGSHPCLRPGCAYIKITGTGLKPDTEYFFQPYTTQWQPSNPGATLTTESDGSILIDDRFATDAPGQQVWVVASADGQQTVTSNKFTWSSQ